MQEVEKILKVSGSNGNINLSLDEQEIGTFVDGSKLFQKTFHFTYEDLIDQQGIALFESGIEKCWLDSGNSFVRFKGEYPEFSEEYNDFITPNDYNYNYIIDVTEDTGTVSLIRQVTLDEYEAYFTVKYTKMETQPDLRKSLSKKKYNERINKIISKMRGEK